MRTSNAELIRREGELAHEAVAATNEARARTYLGLATAIRAIGISESHNAACINAGPMSAADRNRRRREVRALLRRAATLGAAANELMLMALDHRQACSAPARVQEVVRKRFGTIAGNPVASGSDSR